MYCLEHIGDQCAHRVKVVVPARFVVVNHVECARGFGAFNTAFGFSSFDIGDFNNPLIARPRGSDTDIELRVAFS